MLVVESLHIYSLAHCALHTHFVLTMLLYYTIGNTLAGSVGGASSPGAGSSASDVLLDRLSCLNMSTPPLSSSRSESTHVVTPNNRGVAGKNKGGSTMSTPKGGTDASLQPALSGGVSLANTIQQQEVEIFSKSVSDIKQSIMASILELTEELDNLYGPICEQAPDHIHNDECVLVYGYSITLELFLKAAARKRKFQVIIAESAPSLDGHKLALSLSKSSGMGVGGVSGGVSSNISVTLIPDSGIYAIMSRVNKVLISPLAVTADGGAMCSGGHLMVATAAKVGKDSIIDLI